MKKEKSTQSAVNFIATMFSYLILAGIGLFLFIVCIIVLMML